jgi:glycosyltransferase involved in cell wall biosynthesis
MRLTDPSRRAIPIGVTIKTCYKYVTDMAKPFLSITMSVWNRPRLTGQCLTSLFSTLGALTLPIDFELIILNNGSNDETTKILEGFARNPNVQIITIPHTEFIGECKTTAFKYCTGQLIYHSDNDMYFLDGWVEDLLLAHDTFPDFMPLGAFTHPYHTVRNTYTRDGVTVQEVDSQCGNSWLVEGDAFRKYGYLINSLTYGHDDSDWDERVKKYGYRSGAIYPNKVLHCGATASNGMLAAGAELILKQKASYPGVIFE